MSITTLPVAPVVSDSTAVFNAKAFALVNALAQFVSEINTEIPAIDNAYSASLAALGAANFKGDWSLLSGALNIPASVSYGGSIWVLTVNVANVTTEVPGVSLKWVCFGISPTTTLTDAATINWNAAQGQVAKVTLGGNRTMAAPTGLVEGAFYSLNIIQDGTGSRTLSWNSIFKFASGVAPTLTVSASARDYITFKYNGTYLDEQGRTLGVA